MHHTGFDSGNAANHNGDMSGEIIFDRPPTFADIKELFLFTMERDLIYAAECWEFGEVSETSELAYRFKQWRAKS